LRVGIGVVRLQVLVKLVGLLDALCEEDRVEVSERM